jgi:hypothetical protein
MFTAKSGRQPYAIYPIRGLLNMRAPALPCCHVLVSKLAKRNSGLAQPLLGRGNPKPKTATIGVWTGSERSRRHHPIPRGVAGPCGDWERRRGGRTLGRACGYPGHARSSKLGARSTGAWQAHGIRNPERLNNVRRFCYLASGHG